MRFDIAEHLYLYSPTMKPYPDESREKPGLIDLAAAIFVAALLGGFVHLIADVHDMKYATRLLVDAAIEE